MPPSLKYSHNKHDEKSILNHAYKYYIGVLIAVILWGSNFVVIKIALQQVDTLALLSIRFVLSTMILGGICLFRRQSATPLSLRNYMFLFFLGILGIAGFNLGLFYGLNDTSPIHASLIVSLSPLMTLFIASRFHIERVNLSHVIALLLCMLGVFLVIGSPLDHSWLMIKGDLIIFVGTLSWSIYTIFSTKIRSQIEPLQLTFVVMFFGSICIVLLSSSHLNLFRVLTEINTQAWGLILYMAIFTTCIPHLLWVHSVRKIGPTESSLFFNLIPVFATIFAMFTGFIPDQYQIIGIIISFAGLAIPNLYTYIVNRAHLVTKKEAVHK
ncbi:putative DMT superfamily transporter inner membrane protein [Vibrio ruber DSM 16370]|uniref:Putative DMT superfamily transporter inner membrane protein n=1 Tax=Vibrio ruber (strain DSM 16370 / JCM 11486 / BCRC 17186 / CECT 7878 / LMG 23124 / VR1) TaxID=1123498 RepID=A0A1R4LT51_VIBR1|nr:DMT family transporter [Vibrio ruber]SJN59569.1 putative DMT superfamily transporter inner membrane protein [Vibrio ruber DSM 16370]